MTEHLRRAAPRQPTDWSATYRFDSADDDSWRTCRILDISPIGAGLELYQVLPDEIVTGNITISFELRGKGRSVNRSGDGRTARFGIEFPELNEAAREFLNETRGVAW